MTSEASRIARSATAHLPLAGAALPEVYFYGSLGLCVIDAVFSINAKYESTKAAVTRYCDRFHVRRIRATRDEWPAKAEQEPIDTLIARIAEIGAEAFAAGVLRNRQRTSSHGGVLKAEAVRQFALVLSDRGIHCFQDLDQPASDLDLDRALREVHGQSSGVSIQYFWMLTGNENLIKPDRMVVEFLEEALGRRVAVGEATGLIQQAAGELRGQFQGLTPRLLDYLVWNYQRQRRKSVRSESTRR
jgi:hypothetical protein